MDPLDLWDLNDTAASLERFRQLERAATVAAEKAFALTQVARALGMQGDYAKGEATLAEADRLMPAVGKVRAQYWLELGRIQNAEHNPTQALSCFQKAVELARDAQEEYLMVDAAHMIAIVVPKENQPESAEVALSLAHNASNEKTRHWIGPIANNLGWTYMELSQPEKAVESFTQALAYRLTQKERTPIRLARYALGCALRASRQLDEAVSVLNQALAMGGSLGFIEEELAECLFSLGKAEQAKSLYEAAYNILKANTDLEKRDPERLLRLLRRSI
jgi:tetratricopeptide (TPR) repeat protein